jgi:hypothetical protein
MLIQKGRGGHAAETRWTCNRFPEQQAWQGTCKALAGTNQELLRSLT